MKQVNLESYITFIKIIYSSLSVQSLPVQSANKSNHLYQRHSVPRQMTTKGVKPVDPVWHHP